MDVIAASKGAFTRSIPLSALLPIFKVLPTCYTQGVREHMEAENNETNSSKRALHLPSFTGYNDEFSGSVCVI
jgi:hypothetical protein